MLRDKLRVLISRIFRRLKGFKDGTDGRFIKHALFFFMQNRLIFQAYIHFFPLNFLTQQYIFQQLLIIPSPHPT